MQDYQFLAGKYQIEKMLEHSQSSVLCQVKESSTEQAVLLKIWFPSEVLSEEQMTRVRKEVAVLQRVKHSHLLPILDVQMDAQKIFLISECASAGSLDALLGLEKEEAPTLYETLQVIEQVGQALQILHASGITHGNLTPEAVFFSEPGQVKLGEFLIQGVLFGTQDYQHMLDENISHCLYIAPEQFDGTFNEKTDQYALGCLAYVLLTGRVPFAGSARATLLQKHLRDKPQSLTILNPAIPEHIEAAILRSLAKNPLERHSSIQAFLEALDIADKKNLANQNTLKQVTPGDLIVEAFIASGTWEWENAVSLAEAPTTFSPAVAVVESTTHPMPAPYAVRQPYFAQAVRPVRRREHYVIISVVLLVLVLFLGIGRWLFFSGSSGPVISKVSTASNTPASISLTPVTATSAQTTATVISIQIPTPTQVSSTPTPVATTLMPTPATANTPQVLVSLASFFNNEGIGSTPGQANFDGSGFSYPANQLPTAGQITLNGVVYQFRNMSGTNDNIIASGQTIPLTPGKYKQALLLASASWGPATGTVIAHATDGSTAPTTLTVPDWYYGPSNGLSTTSRYTSNGIDPHAVYIFVIPISLDPTRITDALILPTSPSGPSQNSHIHIFALTLLH